MFLQFKIRIDYPFVSALPKLHGPSQISHKLIKIVSSILTLDEKSFTKLLLCGDGRYGSKTNQSIILASIKFSHSSKRFDGQLM